MPKYFSLFGVRSLCWGVLLLANAAVAADFIYVVQPGDHPWNLAQRYLKNAALSQQLLARNKIDDDRRIMPGTRLKIPLTWLRLESAEVRLLAAAGDTMLQQSPNPPRPVVAGEMLRAPSTLTTGATGSASLQFADGSRVLVRRDTQLQVQQAQTRPMGQANLVVLTLLQGSLESEVIPMGDSGGRFEIHTPAAVAAVRGTHFRTHAQDGALRTEVLSGAVSVASTLGQVVNQGDQGSVAVAGQPPGPPTKLLPAPSLEALPAQIERLPIDVPFPALAGAVAYRTQISANPDFAALASDEASGAARIRARDVIDGSYTLRVRAIDAQGLEGQTAQRQIVVHARPEPPLMIEPPLDAPTTATRPVFRWTQGDPTWRYRLQIMGEDGTGVLDDQVVSGATAQATPELTPGLYKWRVAAIDPAKSGKEQGPWGDAQAFRRVLPGPGVEIPPPKDGSLAFRWTAQPQTANYRLQVARDNSFTTPVADAKTEAPQFLLQDLEPGLYYVRVQAIGADGYTGPWGTAQSFTMPEVPQHWRALFLLIPLLAIF
jgi:hypothetical protein